MTIETDIHCTPVIRGGREGAHSRWGRLFAILAKRVSAYFERAFIRAWALIASPLGN